MAEKPKHDQSTKTHIMKVATKLFSERGLEDVSVREIAKASGQNLSMISYYFGGKEGLYIAILHEHMEQTVAKIQEIFVDSDVQKMTKQSFRKEIHAMVSLVTNLKFASPEMSNIMYREKINRLPYAREIHEKLTTPVAEKILEIFRHAQKKGILRDNFDPRIFMGLLFDSIMGYFVSYDCGIKMMQGDWKFPRDKELFIDFVTDLFLQGILK